MKKRKTIVWLLSMILGAVTLMPSCVNFGSESSTESVEETRKPDYSQSTAKYDIWAYSSACDDWYQYRNEKGEIIHEYAGPMEKQFLIDLLEL